MKPLAPDQTCYNKPEIIVDETVAAKPHSKKNQHRRADKRFRKACQKRQNTQRENLNPLEEAEAYRALAPEAERQA